MSRSFGICVRCHDEVPDDMTDRSGHCVACLERLGRTWQCPVWDWTDRDRGQPCFECGTDHREFDGDTTLGEKTFVASVKALFLNAPVGEYAAKWASSGLGQLGEAIAHTLGGDDPSSNTGAAYENDLFVMRAYCWCFGEREGHADGCPPNFVYKPTGLSCSWYKHASRGISSNEPRRPADWYQIISACLASIA